MKYILTIKPAIKVANRHKLQDTLTKMGYYVSGGGTHEDMSCCDISFEEEEDGTKNNRPSSQYVLQ